MSGSLFRSMFNTTLTFYNTSTLGLRNFHTSPVYYAARKGTREKARAKKVKVEVTKIGFIPHNQRGKDKIEKSKVSKHVSDLYKQKPKDDVYPLKFYRWIVYTAEDAVRVHQQTHHPTMYNVPDAFISAQIEFNMQAAKKTRFMDSFTRLTLLPHPFPRDEERTILAFVKGAELMKEVMDAGATVAGGSDVIKKIQVITSGRVLCCVKQLEEGTTTLPLCLLPNSSARTAVFWLDGKEGQIRLSDYDYVVAHPNVLTDLVPIRGLMKRRFPNLRTGTLEADLKSLVKKFSGGIQYRVVKDEHQENFGSVEVPVGRLNMEPKQIAENIEALLKDLQSARPKRDGLFITKCLLVSPPSPEKLKINPFVYVDRTLSKAVQEDSDDEEGAVAAATA